MFYVQTFRSYINIITEQLAYFVSSINAISQPEVCKSKSTLKNLLEFASHVSNGLKNGYPTDVVSTDFSKSFDNASHYILHCKLDCFWFSSFFLKWISTYLIGSNLIFKYLFI